MNRAQAFVDESRELLQALDSGRAVRLDASRAGRTDTAVLQLLCSFATEARKRGLTLEWSERPRSFEECAELLGVKTLLFS